MSDEKMSDQKKFADFGVIGGGAWGTALAQSLSLSGRNVTLWARNRRVIDDINQNHINTAYLPGVPLNPGIKATGSLAEAGWTDCVLMAVPAQHVRHMAGQLKPLAKPNPALVMCAKGIEQTTGKLMGSVIADVMPDARFAVLSGPSFAADVGQGLPAALTLGCRTEALGQRLSQSLSSPHMRLYWSGDVTGVELGGAIKNVLAIAAGIVAGRGLGASAHAALVTRGFAELRRFCEAYGARPETLMGLSGLGDLILTCGSPQSRNMSLGRALGEGQTLKDILAGRTAVTEGVYTAAAVVQLARAKALQMPVCEAVTAIIEGRQSVDQVIPALMQRPLKAED